MANLFEDEFTSTTPSDSRTEQPAGSNVFDAPPAETTSNPFGEETGPVASVPDVVPSAEASIFGGSASSAGSGTSAGSAAPNNPFSTLDVLADSLPATATTAQTSPQQEGSGLIGILNDKSATTPDTAIPLRPTYTDTKAKAKVKAMSLADVMQAILEVTFRPNSGQQNLRSLSF